MTNPTSIQHGGQMSDFGVMHGSCSLERQIKKTGQHPTIVGYFYLRQPKTKVFENQQKSKQQFESQRKEKLTWEYKTYVIYYYF